MRKHVGASASSRMFFGLWSRSDVDIENEFGLWSVTRLWNTAEKCQENMSSAENTCQEHFRLVKSKVHQMYTAAGRCIWYLGLQ